MIARAVAFVEVAVATQVEQIEFVNQTLAFEQVERAIDGDAGDAGIEFLGAFEDFSGVEMAARCFHDLEQDAALFGEADAARSEGLLQVARGFVIDTFASGDAMFWCGSHNSNDSIPKAKS